MSEAYRSVEAYRFVEFAAPFRTWCRVIRPQNILTVPAYPSLSYWLLFVFLYPSTLHTRTLVTICCVLQTQIQNSVPEPDQRANHSRKSHRENSRTYRLGFGILQAWKDEGRAQHATHYTNNFYTFMHDINLWFFCWMLRNPVLVR